MGKYFADTVHREILVVVELLEAKYIDFLLLHEAGYFFAGVTGDFIAEVTDIVGGYFQVAVGVVAAVVPFGNFFGEAELEDSKDVVPIEN